MCRAMEADLSLVTFFDPIPNYLGEALIQAALTKRMEPAQAVINDARDLIGEIPGDPTTDMLEGPPAEAILKLLESRNSFMKGPFLGF